MVPESETFPAEHPAAIRNRQPAWKHDTALSCNAGSVPASNMTKNMSLLCPPEELGWMEGGGVGWSVEDCRLYLEMPGAVAMTHLPPPTHQPDGRLPMSL